VGVFSALLIYCSGQRAMKLEQVKEIKTGYFQRGIRESTDSKKYALSCFQKIAISLGKFDSPNPTYDENLECDAIF